MRVPSKDTPTNGQDQEKGKRKQFVLMRSPLPPLQIAVIISERPTTGAGCNMSKAESSQIKRFSTIKGVVVNLTLFPPKQERASFWFIF